MMARQTKKSSKPAASTKRVVAKKPAVKAKAKKTLFQKLLTADGWKRLMMGKLNKK